MLQRYLYVVLPKRELKAQLSHSPTFSHRVAMSKEDSHSKKDRVLLRDLVLLYQNNSAGQKRI